MDANAYLSPRVASGQLPAVSSVRTYSRLAYTSRVFYRPYCAFRYTIDDAADQTRLRKLVKLKYIQLFQSCGRY